MERTPSSCTPRGIRVATFALLFLLFSGLFENAVDDPFSHSIVYTPDQLLALSCSGLLHAEQPVEIRILHEVG